MLGEDERYTPLDPQHRGWPLAGDVLPHHRGAEHRIRAQPSARQHESIGPPHGLPLPGGAQGHLLQDVRQGRVPRDAGPRSRTIARPTSSAPSPSSHDRGVRRSPWRHASCSAARASSSGSMEKASSWRSTRRGTGAAPTFIDEVHRLMLEHGGRPNLLKDSMLDARDRRGVGRGLDEFRAALRGVRPGIDASAPSWPIGSDCEVARRRSDRRAWAWPRHGARTMRVRPRARRSRPRPTCGEWLQTCSATSRGRVQIIIADAASPVDFGAAADGALADAPLDVAMLPLGVSVDDDPVSGDPTSARRARHREPRRRDDGVDGGRRHHAGAGKRGDHRLLVDRGHSRSRPQCCVCSGQARCRELVREPSGRSRRPRVSEWPGTSSATSTRTSPTASSCRCRSPRSTASLARVVAGSTRRAVDSSRRHGGGWWRRSSGALPFGIFRRLKA